MKIIKSNLNLEWKIISNMNSYYDIDQKDIWYNVELWDVLFYNLNFYKVNTWFSYTWDINDNLWNISLISFATNFEPSNSTQEITWNTTLEYWKNYIINNTWWNIDLLLPNNYVSWNSLLITNIWNDFHITQNLLDTIESTTHITTAWTSWYVNVNWQISLQITCIWNNKFIITKQFWWNLTFN